jgi:hypothetical protein
VHVLACRSHAARTAVSHLPWRHAHTVDQLRPCRTLVCWSTGAIHCDRDCARVCVICVLRWWRSTTRRATSRCGSTTPCSLTTGARACVCLCACAVCTQWVRTQRLWLRAQAIAAARTAAGAICSALAIERVSDRARAHVFVCALQSVPARKLRCVARTCVIDCR